MPRILLIEPDAVLAAVCGRLFSARGFTVDSTASAQTAVHLADEHQPDVVVLELQLPGHNGIEFLYEFRSYYEWIKVPVIIHSFVPPGELAANTALYNELGVRTYLYKPTTSLAKLMSNVTSLAGAAV
jgi:DNA-binding response OmpR family regulator